MGIILLVVFLTIAIYTNADNFIVIEPQFDWAESFSEGLAAVNIGGKFAIYGVRGGKWGYIDKTGKWVAEPQFDGASSFSEGLAAVMIGDWKTGKWGYIRNPLE